MSYFGKLLDITTLGSTVTGFALLQKFLSRLTVIVALTIISSIMVVVLMMAGFYAVYVSLVYYGVAHQAAMVTTGGIALLVTLTLIGITVSRLRQIRNIHHLMLDLPVISNIRSLADSFIEGFFSRR